MLAKVFGSLANSSCITGSLSELKQGVLKKENLRIGDLLNKYLMNMVSNIAHLVLKTTKDKIYCNKC